MTMLAEEYDLVIGGGPDRNTIDLAVLDTVTGRRSRTPCGVSGRNWICPHTGLGA